MIVAFRVDGFMYDARTMSYFVSGCALGGCETDFVGLVLFLVFLAGDPRQPDLKDFVFFSVTILLEAGSIVLSLATVVFSAVASLSRGFSFFLRVLHQPMPPGFLVRRALLPSRARVAPRAVGSLIAFYVPGAWPAETSFEHSA